MALMHFKFNFLKNYQKPNNAELVNLKKAINLNKLNLQASISSWTSPMGDINGGQDIEDANEAGINIIRNYAMIYGFSETDFINHMFCSYETNKPISNLNDVNFINKQDHDSIPCNPDNWPKVLKGLKSHLKITLKARK